MFFENPIIHSKLLLTSLNILSNWNKQVRFVSLYIYFSNYSQIWEIQDLIFHYLLLFCEQANFYKNHHFKIHHLENYVLK